MLELIVSPIGLLVLAIVGYLVSCAVHPYETCESCSRSKESHSKMFPKAFGPCRSCKGRGHTVRLGARLLGKN